MIRLLRQFVIRLFGERHDNAWQATGYRRRFDHVGYSFQKAADARRRADKHQVQSRKAAAQRAKPAAIKRPETVTDIRRARMK